MTDKQLRAEELRIGNYVLKYKYGEVSYSTIPEKVNAGYIKFIADKHSKCLGVELTEEILIAAGFKDEMFGYNFKKDGAGILESFQINIYDRTQARVWNNTHYCGIVHCEYLHQLQNLFYALTGSELEINLSTLKEKV